MKSISINDLRIIIKNTLVHHPNRWGLHTVEKFGVSEKKTIEKLLENGINVIEEPRITKENVAIALKSFFPLLGEPSDEQINNYMKFLRVFNQGEKNDSEKRT